MIEQTIRLLNTFSLLHFWSFYGEHATYMHS